MTLTLLSAKTEPRRSSIMLRVALLIQLQGSAMVVPEKLQAYVGHSRIFGQYGRPWDFRFGTNFFPFKNHVVRWNTEALYLYKSPVGYTSVPYPVGGKGCVFHSSMELAF